MTVVIIQIIELGSCVVFRFVVTSLDPPHVCPVRRRRVICTKQVVRTREPFVQILLNKPGRNDSCLHNPAQSVIACAHVECLFAQHVRHRAAQGRECRVLQHLQLELAIAVHKIGVGEEVHPVVDIDVERAQQSLVLEGAALQHLLRFHFSRIAKMIHQQSAHLPPVTHLFDHHARDGAAIPIRGSVVEQVALLLNTGKLGIALVDDHIHERIAHLLRGNLPQVLPLAAALIVPELDVFGLDCAVKRIELEGLDVRRVHPNLFAPVVEQPDPVTERPNFCYFSRHNLKPLHHRETLLLCASGSLW